MVTISYGTSSPRSLYDGSASILMTLSDPEGWNVRGQFFQVDLNSITLVPFDLTTKYGYKVLLFCDVVITVCACTLVTL